MTKVPADAFPAAEFPATVFPTDRASLELSPTHMREMAAWVVDRTVAHLGELEELPAHGSMDGVEDLCRQLRRPPPEAGAALTDILEPLFETWLPKTYNCGGPGYLAYVPGGGIFPAALADFIADATNRYTGVWNAAPPLVELESNVLTWFRDWMGFPDSTRGLLTTGGSMATFTAVFTAREKLLGTRLREGVLYASSQAHHSVVKAAKLAGVLPDRVREVAVDDHMRMRPDALDEQVRKDRADGLLPFMVVTSAGTTNTGTVDPLVAIGETCRREGLWHHCDGAYGAFFHMCPELHGALEGMSEADSLTLDPHKGLFLPYGTGALLVRDGEALRTAHEATAGYLPPLPDASFYNPVQYGPELSRDFRGLRVWLPLMLYGAETFRAALREKHALTMQCHDALADMPGISILHRPELSLFAFTVGHEGATEQERNDATAALMHNVNERGRVMITGTRIGSRQFARVCVLCFRTRERHIRFAIEDIRAAAAEVLG